MPRLSSTQWLALRADYEMFPDMSLDALGEKHGITKAAIHRRKTKEGWRQNLTEQAVDIALARSQQNVEVLSVKRKKEVVNYADKIHKLLEKHKKSWIRVWLMLNQAVQFNPDGSVYKKDFNLLKCTKITSEIITIAQKGERAAWGIDLDSPKIEVNTHIKNTARLQSKIDWDSISDKEKLKLEEFLKEINEKDE